MRIPKRSRLVSPPRSSDGADRAAPCRGVSSQTAYVRHPDGPLLLSAVAMTEGRHSSLRGVRARQTRKPSWDIWRCGSERGTADNGKLDLRVGGRMRARCVTICGQNSTRRKGRALSCDAGGSVFSPGDATGRRRGGESADRVATFIVQAMSVLDPSSSKSRHRSSKRYGSSGISSMPRKQAFAGHRQRGSVATGERR
jgi:hypothetical protein